MADADEAGGEPDLGQEQGKADDEQGHRDDEQYGDRPREGDFGQVRDEQDRDHEADEQGAGGAGGDGEIHDTHPPYDDEQLLAGSLPRGFVERGEIALEAAAAVDHARQALRQNVQDAGDSRQQEDGGDRQLDQVGDGRNGLVHGVATSEFSARGPPATVGRGGGDSR